MTTLTTAQNVAANAAPTAVTPVQDTPVVTATAVLSQAQYATANAADKFSVIGSVSNADAGQTKEVFNIDAVRTADLTNTMIISAKRTQRMANSQWHYACIGASYQVIQHGNRTPLATLLGSMGKKSQRYQKILECVRTLTGGMLTITENGSGAKATIDFEYKFDMEVKTKLLGDTAAADYDETTTEFYKLCQTPWMEYELANEDYGFDATKFAGTLGKMIEKGTEHGVTLDVMLATVEASYAAGLKAKQEKDAADKKAAQVAMANIEGADLVQMLADAVLAKAPESCVSEIGEINLVLAAFAQGDIKLAAAKHRIAGAEMVIDEAIEEINAAANVDAVLADQVVAETVAPAAE